MNKIGFFLIKFNGLFAFLVLEILALYLYFSQNATPEKTAFLSSANRVVGNLYDYSNRWSRYIDLVALNDALAKENARLKMQLPNSQFSDLIDSNTVTDKHYHQQFQYTAATIVNNSIDRPNNFITLNKGSKHGIRPNTGVVNGIGDGLIGIVRGVSGNYSLVMSLLHKDTRISGKIKTSGDFGILVWKQTNNTKEMTLESVPKHVKIEKGDTIITSGFSTIFPEGIVIGQIDSFYIESGSNFYTIIVSLAADLGQTQYTHVVDNLMREERKELEEEFLDE